MSPPPAPFQIDIVSDVVCPWCIIGWKQLEQALAQTGHGAVVFWHPFQLNPGMPPEGQDMREHLAQKYGTTPDQSRDARMRLQSLGQDLGFTFNFRDDARIYNTFQAHLLIDWAADFNLQHQMKQALFTAYFTDGRDVSDRAVLLDVAAATGLDADGAAAALDDTARATALRQAMQFWIDRGISGVPAMVFQRKYLVTGAQGVENYVSILTRLAAEAA